MPVLTRVEKCRRKRWLHPLILMVIRCAPIILASIAHAASNTDPFAYDPQFDNGVILEDRFASTTTSTTMVGERVFVSPYISDGPNGDIVASGQVAVAYQGSPAKNFGSVRYGGSGQRIGWGDPLPAFSYYNNYYLDWPNLTTSTVSAAADVKPFMGYIFALLDLGSSAVYLSAYTDGGPNTDSGQFVYGHTAFSKPAASIGGVALVPYSYITYNGTGGQVAAFRLIAVATYTSSSGQIIITMERFVLDLATGDATVDTSFGTSGNGMVDLVAPNWVCYAKANCSWGATAVSALRTDTENPTLYLGGTAYGRTAALGVDGVVVAVNGADGSLSSSFGTLGSTGIFINQLANKSDVLALAATTPGAGAAASEDVVYVTSGEAYTNSNCPAKPAAVTKLLAQVPPSGIHELPATMPDTSFANNGTLTFGGDLAGCDYNMFPADMLVDGNRLVIVGSENSVSVTPFSKVPLFAIVRASDGALTDYQRGVFSPLHANGTPWGGGSFNSVALRSSGHYAVTGAIIDASANSASLFGTAAIASDRIFGNGFESP